MGNAVVHHAGFDHNPTVHEKHTISHTKISTTGHILRIVGTARKGNTCAGTLAELVILLYGTDAEQAR